MNMTYARSGAQGRVDKKIQRSRAFSPMRCHEAARIFLTASRSYEAVALHRGACEKLLRDGKLATSSMDAAAVGVAQKEDREEGIDQQDIFDRMVLFLAAITRGLFRRVLG